MFALAKDILKDTIEDLIESTYAAITLKALLTLENALCKDTGSQALRWITSFWGHLTPRQVQEMIILKEKVTTVAENEN